MSFPLAIADDFKAPSLQNGLFLLFAVLPPMQKSNFGGPPAKPGVYQRLIKSATLAGEIVIVPKSRHKASSKDTSYCPTVPVRESL